MLLDPSSLRLRPNGGSPPQLYPTRRWPSEPFYFSASPIVVTPDTTLYAQTPANESSDTDEEDITNSWHFRALVHDEDRRPYRDGEEIPSTAEHSDASDAEEDGVVLL